MKTAGCYSQPRFPGALTSGYLGRHLFCPGPTPRVQAHPLMPLSPTEGPSQTEGLCLPLIPSSGSPLPSLETKGMEKRLLLSKGL